MRILSILLLSMLLFVGIVHAQITNDYDYLDNIDYRVSTISTPFNESLMLKYTFRYYPVKSSRLYAKRISFTVNLDTINREDHIQQIDIEDNKFTYSIEGYCDNRKGNLSGVVSAMNLSYGNGRYSVYGDNSTGYEVYEHSNSTSIGASFSINLYYPPNLMVDPISPEDKMFYKDLLYAIKTNSQMIIKVPYIEGYGANRETKYLTLWITKEVLSEWKDLMQR